MDRGCPFLSLVVVVVVVLVSLSVVAAAAAATEDPVIQQVVVRGQEPEEEDELTLNAEAHFASFVRRFGKSYADGEERARRFSAFKANLRRARRHQLLRLEGPRRRQRSQGSGFLRIVLVFQRCRGSRRSELSGHRRAFQPERTAARRLR